jgi:tripartite-type tricarboxylate transporter receptor subunit TctC
MTTLTRRGFGAALAAGAVLPGAARAQGSGAWPNRQIRWVVPYGPGGGSDFLARTVAAAIAGPLGQPVVIDYATGAGPIANGQLRAIATPAPQRLSLPPAVATLAEQGITGADIYSWQGVVAPTGTPDAAVQRLEAEIARALRIEEVANRLRGISLDPFPGTGAELRALAEAETAIWAPLIRDLGLTLDS